jgi:hypothetical protein
MSESATPPEAEAAAGRLLRGVPDAGELRQLARITDPEFDKVHNAYIVTTDRGRCFFMKHSLDGYEPTVYTVLLDESSPVPRYRGSTPDGIGGQWLFCDLVPGSDIRGGDCADYRRAVEALAKIHASHWGIRGERYARVHTYEDAYEAEIACVADRFGTPDDVTARRILPALETAVARLGRRPQTIVHDDFLPINVLAHGESVTIVDWGGTTKGCYAHDLGRLLGDLRNERAPGWVQPRWHEAVLRAYHGAISGSVGDPPTWEELQLDVRCAKLWNYVEIVNAHWRNRWPRKPWYRANLEALIETSDAIEREVD